jgi:hypothetical protein
MYKQLLVHKKNNLSFSYPNGSLNKYNFQKYNSSFYRDPEMKAYNTNDLVYQTYHYQTLNNQYHYINTIKDGVYHLNDSLVHSLVNLDQLYNLNNKSPNLYSYVMKILLLDSVDFNGRMKYVFNNPINYITTTFRPHDILDVNNNKYYEVYIKDQYKPIYLQDSAKVYDEQGMKKSFFDVIHNLGKKRLLGIDNRHFIKECEIVKVNMKDPSEGMQNDFDVSFLGIGVDNNFNKPIIMDNIIVSLD